MTENLDHLSSADDDSDEDDIDYKPDEEINDLPSECESDGDAEDTKENGETDEVVTTGKRNRGKKKIRKSSETANDKLTELDNPSNEEDEKQKSDALWADFLKDTDIVTKPTTPSATTAAVCKTSSEIPNDKAQIPATKFVKKIFDFAGDKVEVECPMTANEEKSKSISSTVPAAATGINKRTPVSNILKRSSTGGLGAVLGQIGKKTKISTLEKSKLDWNSFKRQQGIDEEIQTHNKGKDGYLERQDFLQRTDLRQFQQEKNLRLSKR